MALFDSAIANYVLPTLGKLKFVDSSEASRDLRIAWTPVNQSIVDGGKDLIANGYIDAPPSKGWRFVKKALFWGVVFGGVAWLMQSQGYLDSAALKSLFGE
ncbi:MAG: hypothetical protein GY737_10050 [Desulfobacteraceae bacterium]|nr:hypothetical protein [Desulfobacteraceae bacterium]